MDDYFYSLSMHSNIGVPVPKCFTELERHLGARVPRNTRPDLAPVVGPYIMLADNLCRRLGDVEYYAKLIADELTKNQGTYSAKAMSTLLVGHFGASKGVLDAASIALTRIYNFGSKTLGKVLSNKEVDFAKRDRNGSFWKVLKAEQPSVYARYVRFQGTIGEIIDWRDAAVHRVHPLVSACLGRNPDTAVYDLIGYELKLDTDPSFARIWNQPSTSKGAHPLHFHQRWKPQLERLVAEVCLDITNQTTPEKKQR